MKKEVHKWSLGGPKEEKNMKYTVNRGCITNLVIEIFMVSIPISWGT